MACPEGRTGAVCRRNLLKAVYRDTMGGARGGRCERRPASMRPSRVTVASMTEQLRHGWSRSRRPRPQPAPTTRAESPAGNVDSEVQRMVDLAPDGILVIGFEESGRIIEGLNAQGIGPQR